MVEQLLTDDALRDRLVAEAREHVLRFDWADVARQTAEVYADLLAAGPELQLRRRRRRRPGAPGAHFGRVCGVCRNYSDKLRTPTL